MPRRFHSLRVNPWHISIFREQGWCSGESARPSMFPGFDSGPVPYAGEFVVGSHLAPRVFSGFSSFPSSTKTNISKFQFDQDRGPAWKPGKADVASSPLKIVILFHFFIASHNLKKNINIVSRSFVKLYKYAVHEHTSEMFLWFFFFFFKYEKK